MKVTDALPYRCVVSGTCSRFSSVLSHQRLHRLVIRRFGFLWWKTSQRLVFLLFPVLEGTRAESQLRSVGWTRSGRKAEELQPDLILLDIGLPSLNGIEAARQCSQLTARTDSGRRIRSGVTSRKATLLVASS